MSPSNSLKSLYNPTHVLVSNDTRNFFSCKKWHRCFSGRQSHRRRSQGTLSDHSLTWTAHPLLPFSYIWKDHF
ncbi:uncharacterized protein SKDI_11G2810 [Saccharomyces kudriavzevii IFO 1802]|uniref:Uncharacterized protein n=2 Tax=Saccharomyces kudriavzevii (strain ATCC MYA-4449 / AS 2.2408 / CBS 8840 / NBRC 1802 / NCYC 2889) TaxID=226230 RepID=A0AA35J400_SACK1|nr:uncharacterized protein SKDI_11G2810 [Saccharomyces kudriavzevii IFO 1802]EJT43988.1 hypothetical protein SKUD_203010 [Saccharomyces kudriavzevii IFO 1802]CAI4045315.1 hypothetical protein SKDI_11G2810 [Saccharomyces kudriavzevii IFO 1802]